MRFDRMTGLLLVAALGLSVVLTGCGGKDDIQALAARNAMPHMIAGDRNGNLVEIDLATGTPSPLMTLDYSDGAVGPISSMVHIPGTLRLIAGHGGNSTCRGCIYRVDLLARTATLLADNTAVNTNYTAAAGMARRSDGVIYVEYESGEQIATINPATGVATPVGGFFDFIGYSGCCGYGIEFVGGTLYMGNNVGLYTVNQTTAEATLLFPWTFVGGFTTSGTFRAMAQNPETGVVYGMLKDESGTGLFYLVTVNLATGALTPVGPLGDNLDGPVFLTY